MNPKIVLIGGGFAGLQACRALRGSRAEVTLIDPRHEAVMLPALPDLACGSVNRPLLVCPFSELLPRWVRHLQVAADSVDLESRTIHAGGDLLSYDHLLIATGSRTDFRGLVNQHGAVHHVDSLESAEEIRDAFPRYLKQAEQPHVLIAGGGYTGLELAAGLAVYARRGRVSCRITVMDSGPELLPFLPAKLRDRVRRTLERLDIEVMHQVRVTGVENGCVIAGPHCFEKVFFCWAAGSRRARPELSGNIDTLRDGRICVLRDLSLPNYPEVFAAGDAAAFEHRGEFLRKAVNFAWYGGSRAGKNMVRRIQGKTTRPFRPVDAGWVIPLQTDSVGKIFSTVRVCGKMGLRLHYLMCGIRNFSMRNVFGFARIAAGPFCEDNPETKGEGG